MKLAARVSGDDKSATDDVVEKLRLADWERPKLDPSLQPDDVVHNLRQSGVVPDRLLSLVSEGVQCSRAISENRNKETSNNPCLVAANARSTTEVDFTTNGVRRGSLRCPFAKQAGNQVNGAQDGQNAQQNNSNTCAYDPIQAELSQDKGSSVGRSARSSAVARCPIRYMDQHSPEEIAQFVENHKHEIPRSHEICVRRYRTDASMREMDAKYGDLVNMIRGLGQKHKPFLDHEPANGQVASTQRVEEWAKDVQDKSLGAEPPSRPEEEANERVGHFERPLRDVRVGESPSRPWGIPIPPTRGRPESPEPVKGPMKESAKDEPAAEQNPKQRPEQQPEQRAKDTDQPTMVFNGPVFFGYSAQDAMAMLQQLNLSKT